MSNRILVALGGNALGSNPSEQLELVKITAKSIVDMIQSGNQVIVCHGNGPQVGMINLSFDEAHKNNEKVPMMPFPECGSMSQGYIAYHLQQAIQNELLNRKLNNKVAGVVTQTVVDLKDPAFKNPTKPIGSFYDKATADKISKENNWTMKEDAGRGWRRVIASPMPIDVVEKEILITLVDSGYITIACGGGGIPVIQEKNAYKGVSAVIDKDFASAKLAEILKADKLVILTAVDQVMINYNKPDQKALTTINLEQVQKYIDQGQFAPGSMLPKIEAAVQFVKLNPDKKAVITSLRNAKNINKTETITQIINK
ncbi:carbamate kinase [Spiroplasma endosymbiont of Amphibalanus improvisus]|uniref:carbamate kinase n=1 Tax=Spiroplasma endosymbiont of Amphibalanus improvisus TaxID=3066327 RepID=UPI00313A82F2